MEGIEKILAYEIQKRLDRGEEVWFFDGKYKIKEVIVYRDGKYDNNFAGFTEEGVRFILETLSGSEAIVTYRPSGTGGQRATCSKPLSSPARPEQDHVGCRSISFTSGQTAAGRLERISRIPRQRPDAIARPKSPRSLEESLGLPLPIK